jgi:hypothetical protein
MIMRKTFFLFICGIGLLFGSSDRGARCWAQSPARHSAIEEYIRPSWQVGQSWVVETSKKRGNIASGKAAPGRPVRWLFNVTRREEVGGNDCFRVDIACRSVAGVPGITIWVDVNTLALRQAEIGLLVQGEVRRVKERYDTEDEAGSPVIGLPSALPIDLPVFGAPRSRSGRFTYQASLADEDRTASNVAFAVDVEQSVKPIGRTDDGRLIGDDVRIDDRTAAYDVRLRSNGREVRQLWKPGMPWPMYSSSGGTTSRLVHVSDVYNVAETVAMPARRTPATTRRSAPARSGMNIGGVDEGQSRFIPWSGPWWPHQQGGLLRQLRKFDLLTGKESAKWEKEATRESMSAQWAGYCHAWAAAAIMEREPRAPRTVTGQAGRPIVLSVGDQKALLTICHDGDVTGPPIGDRYKGPGSDFQDIYPDVLWRALRLYVKQRGIPLIIDRDPGKAVWNHPVYRYRVTHRPHTTPGVRLGTMEIWMADDQVPPDFVGTKVLRKTYRFTFRMNARGLIAGSAKWYKESRTDHPDFAWYPTMVRAWNPHIDPAQVRRMLGFQNPSSPMRTAPGRLAEVLEIRPGRALSSETWATGMRAGEEW